jgi:hypothetical protein
MAFNLIIPQSTPLDPSGRVSREWQQFFINLGNAVAAAGPVTANSGALVANQVVVGNGGTDLKTLAAGTNNFVLTISAGVPTWVASQATPAAGSATQVQYNTGGAFDASPNFVYIVGSNTVSFGGILGNAATLSIQPKTAGTTALKTGLGATAIAIADDGANTKIGVFAATPILQPTTAGAAASFTVNAGTAVNDASTFDGYTLKQVVKALRNLGLLA